MQYNKIKYKGWIYCIRNKVNNKKYIGKTSDIKGYKKRWGHHKSTLKHNKHPSENLQKDYNKHGLEKFEFTILDEFAFYDKELLEKALEDMEKFYINLWDTTNINKGYNTTLRKILCVETGEIFNGTKDINDKMFPNKSTSVIRDHLRGRTKSAYKYHFKYIDK